VGCTVGLRRGSGAFQTSIFGATTQAWKIALALINVYGARMKTVLINEKKNEKKALRQQGLVSFRPF
jgi:hypothetical protein